MSLTKEETSVVKTEAMLQGGMSMCAFWNEEGVCHRLG